MPFAIGDQLLPLDRVDRRGWDGLAANALEPNAYSLPEWIRAFPPSAVDAPSRALTAYDDEGSRLVGLIPVVSAWRALRLPLPILVNADPFHSLGTPLIDAAVPELAALHLLQNARKFGARAILLRHVMLEGPCVSALSKAAEATAASSRIVRAYQRASLDATQDADELLPRTVSARKLKELRRQRRQLEEFGAVQFDIAKTAVDIEAAYQKFLAVENSGWKGKAGTALVSDPGTARRTGAALIAMASKRQCEIATLSAGAICIASGIILRHRDRAYFFKIGIDERFAKYSPGVQLTCDITRHLCADPDIVFADSTATPDHPMIGPMWRNRITVGDLLISLRRNDPLMIPLVAALKAYQRARALAGRIRRS